MMPGYHYWDHVPPLAKDTALVPHEITVNTQTPSLAYNPSSISPLPNLPLGSSFHTGFLVVPRTLGLFLPLHRLVPLKLHILFAIRIKG